MQTNTGYVLASMAAFAFLSSAAVAGSTGQAGASASRNAAQPAGRATTAEPAAKTPARNEAAVPAESKRVRWSLTSGGSQRRGWLVGNRFDWPEFNARNVFGLPDWLSATFEQRTRYETMDGRFGKGQTGGDQQIPLQTSLWLEANFRLFRAGVEFWDARQSGSDSGSTINTTMVDVADFPQIYGAWSTNNLLASGLGFELKGGRQTLDLGSRRLIARNAFRNTTNAFTGLSMRLRDGGGGWQATTFATLPVVRLPDQTQALLDNDYAWDKEQHNGIFTGLFLETNLLPWSSRGELYLYYLTEDENSSRKRELFTPGFRLFRQPKTGQFDYEIESIAQVGRSRERATAPVESQESYYEHVQIGYTFDLPWVPRILAQYDYATGGVNRSFDTLFGARRWEYGPTGIFGPFARNNINSPGYRLFLVPHRDVGFFAAHRLFWLADAAAPWQPAGLVDPTGRSGDFLGHLVEVSARWDAHSNLALEAGWATLIKGGFARNAPDAPDPENVNYFYVQSMLRFYPQSTKGSENGYISKSGFMHRIFPSDP